MELSKYFNIWNGNSKVHSFEIQQHLQTQEATLWDFKSPTHFQPTFPSVWMSCWTHISVPLSFGPSIPLFVTKYLCIETVHIDNRATSQTLLFQGFCSLFPRAIGLPGSEQAQLGAVLREQGPALQSTLAALFALLCTAAACPLTGSSSAGFVDCGYREKIPNGDGFGCSHIGRSTVIPLLSPTETGNVHLGKVLSL